jgi:hypothetical protein
MIQLPGQLTSAYQMYLGGRSVKNELLTDYLKWLRFFLDFCEKYNVEGGAAEEYSEGTVLISQLTHSSAF